MALVEDDDAIEDLPIADVISSSRRQPPPLPGETPPPARAAAAACAWALMVLAARPTSLAAPLKAEIAPVESDAQEAPQEEPEAADGDRVLDDD